MASKKVCKKCKVFVTGPNCPLCNGTQFTESWKGKLTIFKPEESLIAQKIGIKKAGVYAVKTA
ncbi:MAG: DNA-directed RNA polymerase subunit E'' [Nanoarchaeota archaeon]|nr:DNA-directed RNA polymerase subunit E'' [Nanoarchaeota archaeon]